jgi:hypothetical protein
LSGFFTLPSLHQATSSFVLCHLSFVIRPLSFVIELHATNDE